jgi:serine/threonine-protein kinase HipA
VQRHVAAHPGGLVPEAVVVAGAWLWGRFVGAVAEESNGRVSFQYDPDFLRSGWDISPIHLDRRTVGENPISFPELSRFEAFAGLPGVLADALPDRFGNAIIRRYFTDHGRPDDALSPVQRLLYVGSRAMGALEFKPAVRRPAGAAEQLPLDLSQLVGEARSVIQGKADVALPEIMRVGSSAGGARAKAVVLWHRDDNMLRSDFAKPKPGDEHWIIKFDGVDDHGTPDERTKPFNRVESSYMQLAKLAGIDTPPTLLLEAHGLAHLMSKRFDRIDGAKLHLHSLGGLQHADFNSPGTYSYEGLLRTVLTLGLSYGSLEEAYRRAVFNVAMVNQDDHVKNMSFLLAESGGWSLAPAYDLTFAKGAGFTRSHQMSINGKVDGITRDDLLALGGFANLPKRGAEILDAVLEVRTRWLEVAALSRVPEAHARRIEQEFPRLAAA